MSDARLELGDDGADLVIEGDDLARDEGLGTAVAVSILSDARAVQGTSATGEQSDTRGWWADNVRDRFGSRLWTLEREKRTADTLQRARELGTDALRWLIDDGIASRVEVVARYDEFDRLRLEVDIHRGNAPKYAALWAGTTAVKVSVGQAVTPTVVEPGPDQNVVVFLFDDGGAENFDWSGLLEPSYGHVATPRMNEMRARGVTFTRAYATSICGPTRACVHTGRAGFRTGLGGNLDGAGSTGYGLGVYGGVSTETGVARALRLGRDGTADQTLGANAFTFASAWFGKGHVFSDGGQESYPVSQGWGRYAGCPPNAASLENWPIGQAEPFAPGDPEYVTPHENSGHFHFREVATTFGGAPVVETYGAPGAWPAGGPYRAWDPSTTPRAAWDAFKVYRDAIQWINSRTQPFLALVCMNPPHAPFEVPPYTYRDNVGVGATGATMDLISPDTQTLMTSFNGGAGGPGFRPVDINRKRQCYRANIEAIDTIIGLFWDRMDPAKRDRCVFILTGDNGTVPDVVAAPYDPGHSKRTIFEQGMRVPFFVWGSAEVIANPGRECDHLVHVTDVFSTVLDVTGCDPQRWNPGGDITIDGKSLLPVLRDPSATPARTRIYNEIFTPLGAQLDESPSGVPAINPAQWIRCWGDGAYKIIQSAQGVSPPFRFFKITSEAQPASGQPGYLELPDDDLYPLAADGLHPELTDRFQSMLDELLEYLAS
jgi:arylsulfatase A-like enzyme/phage gp46-like protein